MDIVQKIREELVRLREGTSIGLSEHENGVEQGRLEVINALSKYLDSLQKESASGVWHDMSEDAENGRNIIIIDPKDFYGAVLRKGGSQLKNHNKERYVKWAYIEDVINLSNIARTTKDWKEPISEDLITAAKEYAENITDKVGYKLQLRRAVVYGAQWQKEQMMKEAVDMVVGYWMPNGLILDVDETENCYNIDEGDKVKVIVIKE